MNIRAISTVLVLSAQAAAAQDAPAISVQLNSAQPSEGGCRLSFLASSDKTLEQLVFEAVLFTSAGEVDRLTLFDLQDLPAGRARVRQFDVQGLACEGLGQVLVNGLQACSGEGLDPAQCLQGLSVSSRVEGVELAG